MQLDRKARVHDVMTRNDHTINNSNSHVLAVKDLSKSPMRHTVVETRPVSSTMVERVVERRSPVRYVAHPYVTSHMDRSLERIHGAPVAYHTYSRSFAESRSPSRFATVDRTPSNNPAA